MCKLQIAFRLLSYYPKCKLVFLKIKSKYFFIIHVAENKAWHVQNIWPLYENIFHVWRSLVRFIDCQSNICICHFEAYVFGLFWNLVCPALHFVGLIILLEVFNCFSLFGGRHRLQNIQIHVQLYLLILLKQYRFSVLTLKLYAI